MSCFIRSAAWITAGFGQRFAGKNGKNFDCKYFGANCAEQGFNTALDNEEQREIMRKDPEKYLAYRKKIESELNSRFRFILNGSKEQADARAVRALSALTPAIPLLTHCSVRRKGYESQACE